MAEITASRTVTLRAACQPKSGREESIEVTPYTATQIICAASSGSTRSLPERAMRRVSERSMEPASSAALGSRPEPSFPCITA